MFGKLVNKYSNIIVAGSYLIPIIHKKKPQYSLLMIAEVILKVMRNLLIIICPKLIINEISQQKNVGNILLYTLILVVGSSSISILLHVLTMQVEKYDDWFERYFSEEFSVKCMTMDYVNTEDAVMLDRLRKAKDGLIWSGGVGCILDSVKEMTASVISFVSVSAIVLLYAPVLLIIVISVVVVNSKINKKTNEANKAYYDKLSTLNRKMDYSLHEISNFNYGKDIRLFNAQELMVNRSITVNEENASQMKSFAGQLGQLRTYNIIAEYGFATIEYLYIGWLAIRRVITIGDFSMLISSVSVMTSALNKFFEEYFYLELNSEYLCRYVEFMKMGSCVKTGEAHVEKCNEHTIEFKNVYFKYPNSEKYILKNFTLDIMAYEKLSIVGLNGEGKTTMIKLLCRLYKVTKGEILLDGKSIYEYNDEEYNKLFTVVFQDFALLAFTIKENIAFDNDVEDSTIVEICKKSGIYEKCKSLDNGIYTTLFKEFDEQGFEPSGGEKQKLAIARALYKDAPIVILDEPTAALDPMAEFEIYNRFNSMVQDKTVLFISHRMSSCKFCDRIIVISNGEVKENGTHKELMQHGNGLYQKLFSTQAKNYSN